jgi:hypothetical protein
MSMRMRFGVAAAALLGAALFGGLAQAKSATVGDFLVEIAKAKSLSAADPATAKASLTASGVVLPPLALDKVLTEGDVVRIGGSVGVPVTTQNPTAPFDSTQVDNFISTFGKKIVATAPDENQPTDFPNPGTGKGNGKQKGHHKSPTDPV